MILNMDFSFRYADMNIVTGKIKTNPQLNLKNMHINKRHVSEILRFLGTQ